jgi:hypothetical protein
MANSFPSLKATTLDIIRVQKATVGWTTPLAAFKQAIA